MAEQRRRTSSGTSRRNSNRIRQSVRGEYIEGNAVKRLQEAPERTYKKPESSRTKKAVDARKQAELERKRREQRRRQKVLSEQTRQNRARATKLGVGYIAAMLLLCVVVLYTTVHYLKLQTAITAAESQVTSLESEYADIKEDNDAYYRDVTSNVDLNSIKKQAIGQLGMKYPEDGQKMTYKTEGKSYVRQYQDIPDT